MMTQWWNTRLRRRVAWAGMIWLAAATGAGAADASFKNEVQMAIDRGLAWLKQDQNTNGYWSSPDLPALTAMSLMCFKGDPAGKYAKDEPAFIKNGYKFLLSEAKADGGIYHTNYATYNTALGMMALLAANRTEYEPTIRKARQFLVGLQNDFGEPGQVDTPLDGGIGYGSRYKHSDMGNTLYALEAIYYSRHLVVDKNSGEKDLNYAAAISFLQNCQNLPEVNKQAWVSDDPKDKGYYPGHSMAGGVTNAATGKVSLRSYGSISYGGMLSYVYASLKKDDPRVKAVFDWLRGNYTLQENPGMGPEGLFFYYHTMTKALTVAEIGELNLSDGKTIAWRRELAMKLLNLQKRDGSWTNDSNRWMEKDPVLVTGYALLALEMLQRGL
jgi:squalene-hopene/tetraprenyl-beta-curcumene cyclase